MCRKNKVKITVTKGRGRFSRTTLCAKQGLSLRGFCGFVFSVGAFWTSDAAAAIGRGTVAFWLFLGDGVYPSP